MAERNTSLDCPTTVVNSTEEECYMAHLSCKGNTWGNVSFKSCCSKLSSFKSWMLFKRHKNVLVCFIYTFFCFLDTDPILVYNCLLETNPFLLFFWNLRFNCLFPLTEYPVKPGISLKTRWKDAVVYRGHHFAIVCGINSNYKVASMRLTTGVYTQNSTVYAKLPFEGEAVFMFPVAKGKSLVQWEQNHHLE